MIRFGKSDDMKGGCLCGAVKFQIQEPSKLFRYCFCHRCQKVTGSAHASFIYTKVAQLLWLQGEELVQRFDLPDTQYYANCFCKTCGSNIPWQVQQGDTLIIPAGSLDTPADIEPSQAIYWESKAQWYHEVCEFERFDTVPVRNSK